ncbi:MAG: 4-hydroxybenzoate octaprenyltransferase [Planctomycetes bacterium]|jgi:4-hydroxybenzoate polyprenyltransferase|nr:4-hydroxybenzoate octaprenyltransferase [Planctomycetota bacterium]MDP6409488.1 UbiA-like polyprenyltransferase [Planctomycetota bacterium]
MRPIELLSLVKFGHSIFALPFALQGAWLASGGVPAPAVLGWVVLCAVAARTAAMAFNRLVDRDTDARNPRTREREIPSGRVSPAAAAALVMASGAVFVAAAHALNPLCGRLSPPVLALLLGYSLTKRVSFLAHGVLGLSLAIAPLGAWLAVRGEFGGDLAPVLWLAGGVLAWVAGFDLIYACQDASFDRSARLHSIPARFGVARALSLSSALHVLALSCFVMQGVSGELGVSWWAGLSAAAALLVWEHRIVSPADLSRVNTAFFTINGWIGVGLFAGLALDLALGAGGS